MSDTKFCVDCDHCIPGRGDWHAECTHPINRSRDMITGSVYWIRGAGAMRALNGPCGPEGKLFTPKVKRPGFFARLFGRT